MRSGCGFWLSGCGGQGDAGFLFVFLSFVWSSLTESKISVVFVSKDKSVQGLSLFGWEEEEERGFREWSF